MHETALPVRFLMWYNGSIGNKQEIREKRMKNKGGINVLVTLFLSMLYISAFTFGGGYVIVTLMKKRFADELGYITEQEMLDMTALAQSCPGPIAVNAAILVGMKTAGVTGMCAAVLGTVIPPITILSIISVFYALFKDNEAVALALRGMQSGVAAVILDVVLTMGAKVVKNGAAVRLLTMAGAFIAVFFFHVNVILIIAAAALFGAATALWARKKEAGK